jgi:metallo-beta-lactamase class B
VFLGAHGASFNMLGKLGKLHAGAAENVWIDPQGYQAAVAERKSAFEMELMRQKHGSGDDPPKS